MKPPLETLGFPPAWMGYADIRGGRVTVRVCAWCPSKAECDGIAAEAGFVVTHSMCPQCSAAQLRRLMGEGS